MATTGKKRMSQSEVVNHFAEKFDMKRAQVKEIFEELSSLASREVKQNGEFVLPGFGKMVLSERKAREGRNPQTGETIQIPAKTRWFRRSRRRLKSTLFFYDPRKGRWRDSGRRLDAFRHPSAVLSVPELLSPIKVQFINNLD